MEKAFGYLRVSGMAQVDGDGFERQRLAIEKYAQANGYEVVRWFEEKGVSGKAEWDDRPAWVEMIAALNGTRTIIVERLDRLARELFIQEFALRELKKRDVQLLTAAGEDTSDGDPTRTLIRQILGSVFQFERTLLVMKLRGARQRKKAATGRCEGRIPFGMKPDETSVHGLIGQWTEQGLNPTDISRSLNQNGLKTRYGKPWRPWTVNRIVRQIGAKA